MEFTKFWKHLFYRTPPVAASINYECPSLVNETLIDQNQIWSEWK